MTDNRNVTKKGQDSKLPDTQAQGRESARPEPALMPPVDVFEDSSGITLFADLPGVSKEKLNLQMESDSLTIEGELTLDAPEGLESGHAELRVPRYRRVFTLSRELDTEKAVAEFKNGVLKLRIPKAEHAQPRKIDIKVS
jgi:HSP20 family protein